MQASQKFCKLANCFYPFTRTTFAILFKSSTTLLFLPSVACFAYFESTLFSFQGAAFQPFFKVRLKHSTLECFNPISHILLWKLSFLTFFLERKWVVGPSGLEPPTSRLSVARSSQLSYGPVWWRLPDSNRWPPACKAGALPAELNPHGGVYPLN